MLVYITLWKSNTTNNRCLSCKHFKFVSVLSQELVSCYYYCLRIVLWYLIKDITNDDDDWLLRIEFNFFSPSFTSYSEMDTLIHQTGDIFDSIMQTTHDGNDNYSVDWCWYKYNSCHRVKGLSWTHVNTTVQCTHVQYNTGGLLHRPTGHRARHPRAHFLFDIALKSHL